MMVQAKSHADYREWYFHSSNIFPSPFIKDSRPNHFYVRGCPFDIDPTVEDRWLLQTLCKKCFWRRLDNLSYTASLGFCGRHAYSCVDQDHHGENLQFHGPAFFSHIFRSTSLQLLVAFHHSIAYLGDDMNVTRIRIAGSLTASTVAVPA